MQRMIVILEDLQNIITLLINIFNLIGVFFWTTLYIYILKK